MDVDQQPATPPEEEEEEAALVPFAPQGKDNLLGELALLRDVPTQYSALATHEDENQAVLAKSMVAMTNADARLDAAADVLQWMVFQDTHRSEFP